MRQQLVKCFLKIDDLIGKCTQSDAKSSQLPVGTTPFLNGGGVCGQVLVHTAFLCVESTFLLFGLFFHPNHWFLDGMLLYI